MVVDTSAIISILFQESDSLLYSEAIENADTCLISAANALECTIVAEARKGLIAGRELDLLFKRAGIRVVPMDEGIFEEARKVWREFGKGNHPARLNFGDCCALALARVLGMPLLFKGDDFARAKAHSVLA